MNLPFTLPPQSSAPDAIASIALLSTLLLAWLITGRALKARDNLSSQVARRWTANVRNTLVLIAILGLLLIWAPQLRTFALSVTAVAVAIVIATKELILCLSGSAFRTFARAYSIGDIVQIGSYRGEVIDISLFSTSLREVDQREGSIRSIDQSAIIPHSLLFSQPIRVVARAGSPTEHSFDLVFDTQLDLFSRLDELQELATLASSKASGLQSQTTEKKSLLPKIALTTTDIGRVRLEISVKTTTDEAGQVENAITAAIGSLVFSQNPAERISHSQD